MENSSNSSKCSPEWKLVLKVRVVARHSATLQSHFVELYSAFKNGIRGLMVLVGTPKCRNNFNDNVSFNEFLTSNKKIHKKCWSEDVCAC